MVEHLEKGNTTYARHCVEAIVGGGHLILTGVVSVIHGLFPFLFEKYVAKTMITYYWRHFHTHPNPDIQRLITDEKELAFRKQKAYYGVDNVEDFEALMTIQAEMEKESKNV